MPLNNTDLQLLTDQLIAMHGLSVLSDVSRLMRRAVMQADYELEGKLGDKYSPVLGDTLGDHLREAYSMCLFVRYNPQAMVEMQRDLSITSVTNSADSKVTWSPAKTTQLPDYCQLYNNLLLIVAPELVDPSMPNLCTVTGYRWG